MSPPSALARTALAASVAVLPVMASAGVSATYTATPLTVTVEALPGGTGAPGISFASGAKSSWYYSLVDGSTSDFKGLYASPLADALTTSLDVGPGATGRLTYAAPGAGQLQGALTLEAAVASPVSTAPVSPLPVFPLSESGGNYGFDTGIGYTLAPYTAATFATTLGHTALVTAPGSVTIAKAIVPLESYVDFRMGVSGNLVTWRSVFAAPATFAAGVGTGQLSWDVGPAFTQSRSLTLTLSNATGAPATGKLYYDLQFGVAQWVPSSAVTPVPEPATYALMLAGLAVVGAAARPRRAVSG